MPSASIALPRDVFGARRAELPPGLEPAMAAMLLGSAVDAAVHAAVFERPQCLHDGPLVRTGAPGPGHRLRAGLRGASRRLAGSSARLLP